MKTRSVKVNQVSALSTGVASWLGMTGMAMGTRQGPMAPTSSQAEAAPGPPLKANITGRLGPAPRKAVVTISAKGAFLASVRRVVSTAAVNGSGPDGRVMLCWLVRSAAWARGARSSRARLRMRRMPEAYPHERAAA